MDREGSGVLSHARAVVARAVDGEGGVRGIDFDGGPRRQLSHIHGGLATRHAELDEAWLLVVEADLRPVGGAHERERPHLDLDVAAATGVEDITRGERSVERRRSPILSPRAPERHLAIAVAHASGRDIGGRCGSLRLGRRWRRDNRGWLGARPRHEARTTRQYAQHQDHRDDAPCTHGRLLGSGNIPVRRLVPADQPCRGVRRTVRRPASVSCPPDRASPFCGESEAEPACAVRVSAGSRPDRHIRCCPARDAGPARLRRLRQWRHEARGLGHWRPVWVEVARE